MRFDEIAEIRRHCRRTTSLARSVARLFLLVGVHSKIIMKAMHKQTYAFCAAMVARSLVELSARRRDVRGVYARVHLLRCRSIATALPSAHKSEKILHQRTI